MDKAAEQLFHLTEQLKSVQREYVSIRAGLDKTIGDLIDLSKRLADSEEQMKVIRTKISDILTLAMPQNWRILAQADDVILPPESEALDE